MSCGGVTCAFVSGTGIVGVAMAFACAGALRLDAAFKSNGDGGGISRSSSISSIQADIFMTDLAPYVAAAQLTLLQNR